MPLTDKEREDLAKLKPEELIDLYGAERDKAQANEKTAREERAEIMRAFLNGANTPAPKQDGGEDNTGEAYDESKDPVLERLANKFKRR